MTHHEDWPGDTATPPHQAAEDGVARRLAGLGGEKDAPAVEVWDGSVPPGGFVCSLCGWPTESEPCEHLAPTTGCCSACGGYGRTTYEMCWDCRGTGCAHPEPLCVLPPENGRA
jgi:hypothetical protein